MSHMPSVGGEVLYTWQGSQHWRREIPLATIFYPLSVILSLLSTICFWFKLKPS